MFDSSMPVYIQYLNTLSRLLKKAEEHCTARKIDPAVMAQARLYPDMFPLTRQVQIASDTAKFAGARLSGNTPPAWPDDEKTFPELQARITKAIDYLGSLDKAQFKDAATRAINFKAGSREYSFTGREYLTRYALPNFFFHVVTAYDILRHNGVELSKNDYLAA